MSIRINGDNTTAAPGIAKGDDTDTGIQLGTDEVNIVTGGTSRATVDSSGRLLVGANSGTGKFIVQDSSLPKIQANYADSKHLEFGVGGSGGGFATTTGHFMTFNHQPYADRGTDNNLTARARLDAAGQIQVGNNLTKTDVASTVASVIQTRFDGSFTNYSAIRESGPASFCFGRANGSGSQILSNGDEIGGIRWAGADGTDLQTQAALIQCFVHGTPSSNNMPGRLKFSTSDGANAPTERLGIDSDGKITTNGVQHQSARGASTGSSTFTRDFNIGSTQSALVIAAFNHYGLFSYGCCRVVFAATGASHSTETVHNQTSTPGGSWSISKPQNHVIRVTKDAGNYNGSGHWFIHVIAS